MERKELTLTDDRDRSSCRFKGKRSDVLRRGAQRVSAVAKPRSGLAGRTCLASLALRQALRRPRVRDVLRRRMRDRLAAAHRLAKHTRPLRNFLIAAGRDEKEVISNVLATADLHAD